MLLAWFIWGQCKLLWSHLHNDSAVWSYLKLTLQRLGLCVARGKRPWEKMRFERKRIRAMDSTTEGHSDEKRMWFLNYVCKMLACIVSAAAPFALILMRCRVTSTLGAFMFFNCFSFIKAKQRRCLFFSIQDANTSFSASNNAEQKTKADNYKDVLLVLV